MFLSGFKVRVFIKTCINATFTSIPCPLEYSHSSKFAVYACIEVDLLTTQFRIEIVLLFYTPHNACCGFCVITLRTEPIPNLLFGHNVSFSSRTTRRRYSIDSSIANIWKFGKQIRSRAISSSFPIGSNSIIPLFMTNNMIFVNGYTIFLAKVGYKMSSRSNLFASWSTIIEVTADMNSEIVGIMCTSVFTNYIFWTSSFNITTSANDEMIRDTTLNLCTSTRRMHSVYFLSTWVYFICGFFRYRTIVCRTSIVNSDVSRFSERTCSTYSQTSFNNISKTFTTESYCSTTRRIRFTTRFLLSITLKTFSKCRY